MDDCQFEIGGCEVNVVELDDGAYRQNAITIRDKQSGEMRCFICNDAESYLAELTEIRQDLLGVLMADEKERRNRQQVDEQRQKQRQAVLDKLTPEERKLLGM